MVKYELQDSKDPKNSYKFDNEIIPYLGLVWNITNNLSTYASWTSIFEAQNKLDVNEKALSPIEGNTYEVGFKSTHFDNRLNIRPLAKV